MIWLAGPGIWQNFVNFCLSKPKSIFFTYRLAIYRTKEKFLKNTAFFKVNIIPRKILYLITISLKLGKNSS